MGGVGEGTGAVAAAVAAAVLAKAGLAQLGLFPQDDIIPFSELMRASGAWHMGSSHFLAEGFRNVDMLFKWYFLLCIFLS